jgi:hypothetical protein
VHDRNEAKDLLFDNLFWLEHLAVLMCEVHEAVPGQLEDERRHCDLFQREVQCTRDPIAPIEALIDWCKGLEGAAQFAVLNLVAEVWLEEILNTLADDGPREHHDLFASVAADERRHCGAVVDFGGMDPAPYVRILEKHLHAIAADPRFMWPLCYLLGTDRVTAMAKRLHEGHEKVCERLEVGTGEHFSALLACRAEAEADRGVEEIDLDHWRRSAFNMQLQPMTGFRRIEWHWNENPAEIEARFVRAVHRTLAFNPQFNRTINIAREEIYAPCDRIVGVRRLGKPGIVTAYVKPEEDLETLNRYIRLKARQARAAAVEIPKIDTTLLRLQPAPRAAAVVTSLQGLGGIDYGLAPLSPIEGAVWSVGVPGEIRDGAITVGVLADHRAVDGRELCEFLQHLEYHLGVQG